MTVHHVEIARLAVALDRATTDQVFGTVEELRALALARETKYRQALREAIKKSGTKVLGEGELP